jgi:apolipoprotein N-acyltransferase
VVPDPQARFDAGQTLSSSLVGRRVDVVVWGESSVGFDLAARPDLLERLRDVSARVGGDLLVNVDARGGDGGIRKTSVLVDPAGVRGQYTKTRLVPFGEYVPFRRVLGWLTLVSRAAPEDRGRGSQVTVLTAGKVRVGPLVCFESAFPDLARTAARRGADVIVYQTATSTFQGSWAPAQHASLAAVRAVETGRPVLQAALTGTSAAYAADGRRLAWFDTDRRGVVEVSLPLATRTTPYDRLGDWVPAVAFAGLVLSLLAAALRVARSSSADPPPPGGIVGNEASP